MIRCVRVQECGGNGVCSAALTCDCAVGYAGDSCGLCADGYNKDGALCLIIGPPPVAPPDSSPVALPLTRCVYTCFLRRAHAHGTHARHASVGPLVPRVLGGLFWFPVAHSIA